MQEFNYDQQKDTYTCPNQQVLSNNGKIYNKNKNAYNSL